MCVTDPKTGISEPTVTLPIGMDCRESSMAKLKRLGLDRVAVDLARDVREVDTLIMEIACNVDDRHEKGCVRRFGAVPDTWVDNKDCSCH